MHVKQYLLIVFYMNMFMCILCHTFFMSCVVYMYLSVNQVSNYPTQHSMLHLSQALDKTFVFLFIPYTVVEALTNSWLITFILLTGLDIPKSDFLCIIQLVIFTRQCQPGFLHINLIVPTQFPFLNPDGITPRTIYNPMVTIWVS